MKRIKNLYRELLSQDRIKEIILLASKGKKKRKEVTRVLDDMDFYSAEILRMLESKTFYMKPYRKKTITEKGKTRELTISPFFPNRILDYLVVESLKPHIRKSMYEYCVGNVDKRGLIFGKDAVARKYKKYKYYIKLDISKFYPSVSSAMLYSFAESKIKDKDMLGLIKCVITQTGDMPIGSYYSQWMSNWLLQGLDHMVKEKMSIPFYVRYVDDMLLMGNSKKKLSRAMRAIESWLRERGLRLKRIERVYSITERPIDFLGFRFRENGVILRTRNFKAINRKVKKVRKSGHVCVSQARSLLSCMGWLKQIKTGYRYYSNRIKGVIRFGSLRKIVSDYDLRMVYA